MLNKPVMIAMRCGFLLLASSAAASEVTPAVPGGAQAPDPEVDAPGTVWHIDSELVYLLEKEVTSRISAKLPPRSTPAGVDVTVSINMHERMILVEFGQGFALPPGEVDGFLDALAATLRYHAVQSGLPINGVELRVPGRPPSRHYAARRAVQPPPGADEKKADAVRRPF